MESRAHELEGPRAGLNLAPRAPGCLVPRHGRGQGSARPPHAIARRRWFRRRSAANRGSAGCTCRRCGTMPSMSDGTGLAPASARDAVHALEAALEREQKKVALVQEVSRALSQTENLDALLALIMAKVTELMEAERSTLYLLTEDGRQVWSKVSQGS